MAEKIRVLIMAMLSLPMLSVLAFPPKRTDKGYVDAVTKGADIWIQLSVVDDGGAPVPDADVRATLAFHDGFRHTQGRTDSLGKVSVRGVTTGDDIVLRILKDGYYSSEYKTCYLRFAENRAVEDGKWQPWGERKTVVLRKIGNPAKLCRVRDFLTVPSTNEWVGLDLAIGDWVKPYGKGVAEDLQLNVLWDGLPKAGCKNCMVAVRVPGNCNAGYFADKVKESEYASPLGASTNNVYVISEFDWIERNQGLRMQEKSFWNDKSLVLRLRCEVDERGEIVKANYCCVQKLEVSPGMKGNAILDLVTCFNPIANDVNLEDAERARLSRLRYKQILESEGKTHAH